MPPPDRLNGPAAAREPKHTHRDPDRRHAGRRTGVRARAHLHQQHRRQRAPSWVNGASHSTGTPTLEFLFTPATSSVHGSSTAMPRCIGGGYPNSFPSRDVGRRRPSVDFAGTTTGWRPTARSWAPARRPDPGADIDRLPFGLTAVVDLRVPRRRGASAPTLTLPLLSSGLPYGT